ncbi:14485_t:CDS:1, partial [Cetraspora pellucida]
LSTNSIERKNHLKIIHSEIFNAESYEWLIADAKLNDDKTKEMEYAKKYYEDSLDTVKVGIASYVYGKCLIEYEDKINDAKEKFKKAFFIGGYLKAIEKLKEYFDDDIKNEYQCKYEEKTITGSECFLYGLLLLSDPHSDEKRIAYIIDIFYYGHNEKNDRNCL